MKNISIWKDTVEKIEFHKLDKDKECDVLIIGGGITGASCYYFLKNSNLNVLLVEQNKIGMGVTSNSTGKLSFMQNDLLENIRNSHGDLIAKKYLKSQLDAINLIVDIIKKEKINCDLVKVDSSIYTNDDKKVKELKSLENFLIDCGIKIGHNENKLVKEKYSISASDTYIFHPVKFVYGLLKDLPNIYEDSSIIDIREENGFYYAYTSKYKIKTKWIIIASHYPYFNIPFMFPFKGTLEKSYLSASLCKVDDLSLISYSNPFISMRTYKDYLIYLSNSHLINKDIDDKKHFMELKKKLKDLKLKPDYLWSNSDIMTNDYLPFIGEIKDKMILATGYNTWGLANSVLAGNIIKDIILDNKNEYIEIFDPSRVNVDKIIKVLSSSYHSIEGYTNGLFSSKEKKIFKCPHMKCTLVFNEIENTYDCPCHGSRFNIDGTCINAPSNQNIDIKK